MVFTLALAVALVLAIAIAARPGGAPVRAQSAVGDPPFSGTWTGTVSTPQASGGTATFDYVLNLVQHGAVVSGTDQWTGTGGSLQYAVQGTVVSDTLLDLQETQELERRGGVQGVTCLDAGRLTLLVQGIGGATLTGALIGMTSTGAVCDRSQVNVTRTSPQAAAAGTSPVAARSPVAATPAATPPPPTIAPVALTPPLPPTPPPAATPPPLIPPAAPSDLQAQVLGSTMVQLTWTSNSTNEDGFQLHDDIASTDVTGGMTAAGVTTYTLTVQPNGLYCLTVYAFNAAGTSDLSNEACAVTPP